MPIADTDKFNVQITVAGSLAAAGSNAPPAFNTFNYLRTNSLPAFNKASISTIFQTTILVPLLAATNVRYAPGTVKIRCIDDYLDADRPFAAAGTGAIATDALPSNLAVYIEFLTALRGGSYRGGKHFGGVSEIDTTGDVLTGAGLARWQAVATACALPMVDVDGNTWYPSIFAKSKSLPKLLPIATIVANIVSSTRLTTTVGRMKKRRAKSTH